MHLRPWEIERLTEPEILLCLDDNTAKRRPPSYGTPLQTDDDVREWLEKQRRMTPEERLRQAMEGD